MLFNHTQKLLRAGLTSFHSHPALYHHNILLLYNIQFLCANVVILQLKFKVAQPKNDGPIWSQYIDKGMSLTFSTLPIQHISYNTAVFLF